MIRVCIFLALFLPSALFATEKVNVDFEWEEAFGAKVYEVEVLDSKTRKVITKTDSPSSTMRVTLAPGAYLVRGRVIAISGRWGDWSELKDFLVPPKSIPEVKVVDSAAGVNENRGTERKQFEWPPAIGAGKYQVSIFDQEGVLKKKVFVKDSKYIADFRAGIYSYEITPVTSDGVAGEPHVSKEPVVIASRPIPSVQDVAMINTPDGGKSFTWRKETKLPTVVSLEYQKHFSEHWSRVHKESIEGDRFDFLEKLRPGKYRATLWNQNKVGDVSQQFKVEFIVKPLENEL